MNHETITVNAMRGDKPVPVRVDGDLTVADAVPLVALALDISPEWPGLLLVDAQGDPLPEAARMWRYHGRTVLLWTRETLTHTQALIEGKR